MKVQVEVVEYISYSTQEIEGYECCLTWGNNKEYLYLNSYRDSYILEYLEQRGLNNVVIDYHNVGYDYVAWFLKEQLWELEFGLMISICI